MPFFSSGEVLALTGGGVRAQDNVVPELAECCDITALPMWISLCRNAEIAERTEGDLGCIFCGWFAIA